MLLCVFRFCENNVVCSKVMILGGEGFLYGVDMAGKKNLKESEAVVDGIFFLIM